MNLVKSGESKIYLLEYLSEFHSSTVPRHLKHIVWQNFDKKGSFLE